MRAHLTLDALWVIESNPLISFDEVGHLLVIDLLDSGTLGDELTDLGIAHGSSVQHHEERKNLTQPWNDAKRISTVIKKK